MAPALCKNDGTAYRVNELLRRFAKHHYIVEVIENNLPFDAGRHHVHGTLELECAECVAEFEYHTYNAIETMIGREYHFGFVYFINFNSPISTISNLRQKMLLCKANLWIRPRMVSCESSALILCKVYGARIGIGEFVFFWDKYYRCGSSRFCGLNGILCKHPVNLRLFGFVRFSTRLVRCRVYWGFVQKY